MIQAGALESAVFIHLLAVNSIGRESALDDALQHITGLYSCVKSYLLFKNTDCFLAGLY